MPPTVVPKRNGVRKPSRVSSIAPSILSTTLSSENLARPVARTEFQELAQLVAQLKKESSRQVTIGSTLESDFELVRAQATANKASMGTLAELVLEKTNELQQLVSSQLQQLQVESEQKLTDIQLALDRLEFRFKHHVRDFQAVAEQVEAQQNAHQTLRSQLSQTQTLLDTHHENQRTFMEAVQYEVTTAQVKAAQAANEWNDSMMSFQERMIAYVKQVQDDAQDQSDELTKQFRDIGRNEKRQAALLNQTEEEVAALHKGMEELGNMRIHVQREQERSNQQHEDLVRRQVATEHNLSKILYLVERSGDCEHLQRTVKRLESNVKLRMDAVLECSIQLITLCVQQ